MKASLVSLIKSITPIYSILSLFFTKDKSSSFIVKKILKNPQFWIDWPKVKAIKGWLTLQEAYLLFFLAGNCNKDNVIVEIGSYEGRSTVAMASGTKDSIKLYAVDPHTGDKTEVEANLTVDTYEAFIANTSAFQSIKPLRMFSHQAPSTIGPDLVQLLFIDGWHSEEAVRSDIETWIPHRANVFTVVIDDWNQGEVLRGIISCLDKLPPLLGYIGKDMVFSSDKDLRKSDLGQYLLSTRLPQDLVAHRNP